MCDELNINHVQVQGIWWISNWTFIHLCTSYILLRKLRNGFGSYDFIIQRRCHRSNRIRTGNELCSATACMNFSMYRVIVLHAQKCKQQQASSGHFLLHNIDIDITVRNQFYFLFLLSFVFKQILFGCHAIELLSNHPQTTESSIWVEKKQISRIIVDWTMQNDDCSFCSIRAQGLCLLWILQFS